MRTSRLAAAGLAVASLVLAGAGCADRSASQPGSVSVAASFYPLAFVAERVGGDLVRVTTLTPAGAEPHDFEPTAKEVAAIYESDIFLYNGGGVDAWASKLGPDAAAHGVRTLEMRDAVGDNVIAASEEEEPDGHGEERETFDEHFWLDPSLVAREAEAVRDALAETDPENADAYRANARAFAAELESLDRAYRDGLSACETPVAVTSHAAFGYLARRYGFEQIAIAGVNPESEPSAGDLARLADEARSHGVQHIFFETLVNPKLANTLASEIGAETLVFNPLEGLLPEEIEAGATYFTVMRENLSNLRIAMMCR